MEMAGKRKTYTREFKVEAVRLLDTSGKPGHEIEKELGIGGGQIYRWRVQLAQEGSGLRAFPGNGKPRDEELAAKAGGKTSAPPYIDSLQRSLNGPISRDIAGQTGKIEAVFERLVFVVGFEGFPRNIRH
jgi:transposase-like protein